MKKSKRLFAAILCLLVMLTAFTGCGGRKPEPEPEGSAETEATQPPQEPGILTEDERQETMYGDRTVITLGTYGGSYDSSLIDEFNQSQEEYVVEVIDYMEDFLGEPDRAIQKLITEIMSGKGPDVIDLYMWGVDLGNYARKGVIEDLYPWIDADEELSQDSFVESVLSVCEVDGGLYATMSGFSVQTMSCVKSVADEVSGWSLEDFYPYSKLINSTALVFLDDPEVYDVAANGFQTWDGESFLRLLCETTLTSFVDYTTGEAKLDSPEFVELLECCKNMQNAEPTEHPKLYLTNTWDFFDEQGWEYVFGEEMEFIGLPGLGESDGGNFLSNQRNYFAMNALSSNKEGAWAFMRTVLTEEYQLGSGYRWRMTIPTNKAAFNKKLADSQEQKFYTDENGEEYEDTKRGDLPYCDYHPVTDYEANKIIEMIDSLIGMKNYDQTITDIVMSDASAYFAGAASAEETAKMIQNRVTLYLGEQG